ncbi:immunity protein YezG family protein, partial [Staphylococcus aureus]|uniref:immunity protein YezG family protein n=1 Tax=Staphylococcus aureus TaxID=1280 RepID=UPI0037D9B03A
MQLYRSLKKLTNIVKQQSLQPCTSCEFHFTTHPKLNLSFHYIHSINTHFHQLPPQNYYIYKKFRLIPQIQYQIQQLKQIQQYIKEQ